MRIPRLSDLNQMSTALLTDRQEYDDAGQYWPSLGDDEPDFMTVGTIEQICLFCLTASPQARTIPAPETETELVLTGRAGITGLVTMGNPADWGFSDDPRYESVAPQASPLSQVADETHETKEKSESSPVRILEASRPFNYTLIAAASGSAAGTALVLADIFFESRSALFVGLSLFIVGSLAWLTAFSWIVVVVIRVARGHGWGWLKRSSYTTNKPATEPPENSP